MGGDPHWSKLCCKRAGPWEICGDRTAALAYAQAATLREDCRPEKLSPSESGEETFWNSRTASVPVKAPRLDG